MPEPETKEPLPEPRTMNQMAAETTNVIETIEDMADALMDVRPDLRDTIDRHVTEIKNALVGQYFAEAFAPEPETEPE